MAVWGWHADALRAVQEVALKQRLLTCDDIHPLIDEPSHHNKWGPVFNDAQKLGMVRPTRTFVKSKRPLAKGRNLQVWESRCFDYEGPLQGAVDQLYEEIRSNQLPLIPAESTS